MSNLKEKLLRIGLEITDIKMQLEEEIKSLPDNQNIERLKGQTGAFIMSSLDVFADEGMNMSPRYYDFKYQQEFLCEIIERVNPFELEAELKKIVANGTTKYWYDGHRRFGTSTSTFKFHPSVIKSLQEIIRKNF